MQAQHLGKKGIHLNDHGTKKITLDIISLIKQLQRLQESENSLSNRNVVSNPFHNGLNCCARSLDTRKDIFLQTNITKPFYSSYSDFLDNTNTEKILNTNAMAHAHYSEGEYPTVLQDPIADSNIIHDPFINSIRYKSHPNVKYCTCTSVLNPNAETFTGKHSYKDSYDMGDLIQNDLGNVVSLVISSPLEERSIISMGDLDKPTHFTSIFDTSNSAIYFTLVRHHSFCLCFLSRPLNI